MADALMGKICPSGKLAESWPKKLEDIPCHRYYPGTQRTAEYREALFVGYRYYQSVEAPVRYPFGHGLSYTAFAYSDLQADSRKVSFTLTNVGNCDGAEVAQIYIGTKISKLIRPKRELKGFRKVFLKAGESRRVTVELDDKAFRYFNTLTNRWEMETAHYTVEVAASAADIRLSATIRLIGTDAPIPTGYLPSYAAGTITDVPEWEFATLLGHPVPNSGWGESLELNDPICRFADAQNGAARWLCRRLEKKLKKRSGTDMTELFILNMPIRSLAQMSGGKISRAMTEDVVYWANGHFWGGLTRLVRGYFTARKLDRAYRKELDYGPRDN
jgi:beta-glucosidase